MWLEIRISDTGDYGLLVMAVYGPHTSHPQATRQEFWALRKHEWQELRAKVKYQGWRFLAIGDFNLHFADLCAANIPYEEKLDREVRQWLGDSRGSIPGVTVRNP